MRNITINSNYTSKSRFVAFYDSDNIPATAIKFAFIPKPSKELISGNVANCYYCIKKLKIVNKSFVVLQATTHVSQYHLMYFPFCNESCMNLWLMT